jgi:DNA processing protein
MALSTEYLLTLLKTPKIGNVTTKLVNSAATYKITQVSELLDLIIDVKKTNPRVPIPKLDDLYTAYEASEKIIENCSSKGIDIVDINSSRYPKRLLRLSDHPIIGYVKGNISALNSDNAVAVIGTREPTPHGLKSGKRIATIMGQSGFTIISGLAVGCDSAGHIGALIANAPTVAVLASGIDLIYPKENKLLAEEILLKNGALFSEYEPGIKPNKASFVERDRLQSGLSDGIIVVETDIKGGTMHTVGFAQKLNIPIACLSSHPDNLQGHDKVRGNKHLISNGAYALGNTKEITHFFQVLNPNGNLVIDSTSPINAKNNTLPTDKVLSAGDVVNFIPALVEDIPNKILSDSEIPANINHQSKSPLTIAQKVIEKAENNLSTENLELHKEIINIKELLSELLAEQKKGNQLLQEFIYSKKQDNPKDDLKNRSLGKETVVQGRLL